MDVADVECNEDKEIKLEIGKTCVLKCRCPRCGKIFNRRFKHGYFGPIRGPLRFNCRICEETIEEMYSIEDEIFILNLEKWYG